MDHGITDILENNMDEISCKTHVVAAEIQHILHEINHAAEKNGEWTTHVADRHNFYRNLHLLCVQLKL